MADILSRLTSQPYVTQEVRFGIQDCSGIGPSLSEPCQIGDLGAGATCYAGFVHRKWRCARVGLSKFIWDSASYLLLAC
jgi:hypothetical protein